MPVRLHTSLVILLILIGVLETFSINCQGQQLVSKSEWVRMRDASDMIVTNAAIGSVVKSEGCLRNNGSIDSTPITYTFGLSGRFSDRQGRVEDKALFFIAPQPMVVHPTGSLLNITCLKKEWVSSDKVAGMDWYLTEGQYQLIFHWFPADQSLPENENNSGWQNGSVVTFYDADKDRQPLGQLVLIAIISSILVIVFVVTLLSRRSKKSAHDRKKKQSSPRSRLKNPHKNHRHRVRKKSS